MNQLNGHNPAQAFAAAFRDPVHQAYSARGSNGLAAVFVHGFPGSPAEMRATAEVFERAGWAVSVPLLPGFGAEIDTLPQRGYPDWEAAVDQAVTRLRSDHHTVVIVGFSLGGALALGAAARGNVDGAIAVNPFWKLENILWKLLPAIRYALPTFKPFSITKIDFSSAETREGIATFMPDADLDDPDVQQAIRDFAIPTSVLVHIRTAGETAAKRARSIRVPVLIVQGKDDMLVRPLITRELSSRIGGAEYRETPGEHNLLASPAAVTVNDWALDFAVRIAAQKEAERSGDHAGSR